MKYTKAEIKFWMQTAAEVNHLRVGKMKNGRLCLYKLPEDRAPRRSDVVITEAQFVKDMERGWH